ncbi:MAG: winged helix-turn-helix transcriptional regulator [Microcystaceae cyanobacterium]
MNIQTNEKGQKKAVEPCFQPCAIERGMRIIGGKWTGSILWHLKDEPVRFNDLARQLSGASKKVIADRLKEMENNKLIVRTVISTRPVAVTYEITDFGRTALDFLDKLKEWVEKHNDMIA